MTQAHSGPWLSARTIAGLALMLLQVSCTSQNTAAVDSVVSTSLFDLWRGRHRRRTRQSRRSKKGYGPASREQNTLITSDTSDTVFDLASVSKQFTGIALLILVQCGLLSMEDHVGKYVPEVPVFDPQRPIKISDLSNHSSGPPDSSPDQTPTEAATFAWLSKRRDLDFATGSRWAYRNRAYRNLNYFVLGRSWNGWRVNTFDHFWNMKFFFQLG